MTGDGTGYDAARIEVLDGREAIRKRPGMYVGSIGERGLHHLVFDVVGRAVDQFLAGRCGSVDVTLTADGGVRVADDGPQDPFEIDEETGGPGLEALLTGFLTDYWPSGRRSVTVSHFNVGLFVVNALSSRLTAEVRCEGVHRLREYACGAEIGPTVVAVEPTAGSGTTVAFWPDTGIFETTQCLFAVLAERFRQLAFLNRGLRISLTDERPAGGTRAVSFRYPDGVRDFVAALDAETGMSLGRDVIGFEREDPRMAGTMEVALLWSGSGEERTLGFANSGATAEGGAHLDGFRDGVTAAVTAYARGRGLSAATDADPCAHRIGAGLKAVVSVKLDRPKFLGSTRGLLGNPDVRMCVGEAVREHLANWFEERPEQAMEIVDRMVRGTHEL
ncbi:DNA gyrase subunit B [Streptomyces sp. NPDC127119]|uniref:DNA gyrase subunit B n=1 Tax=Streptomyces sp. NPDC127119 TaxID=3345370 RepID=UPI003637666E